MGRGLEEERGVSELEKERARLETRCETVCRRHVPSAHSSVLPCSASTPPQTTHTHTHTPHHHVLEPRGLRRPRRRRRGRGLDAVEVGPPEGAHHLLRLLGADRVPADRAVRGHRPVQQPCEQGKERRRRGEEGAGRRGAKPWGPHASVAFFGEKRRNGAAGCLSRALSRLRVSWPPTFAAPRVRVGDTGEIQGGAARQRKRRVGLSGRAMPRAARRLPTFTPPRRPPSRPAPSISLPRLGPHLAGLPARRLPAARHQPLLIRPPRRPGGRLLNPPPLHRRRPRHGQPPARVSPARPGRLAQPGLGGESSRFRLQLGDSALAGLPAARGRGQPGALRLGRPVRAQAVLDLRVPPRVVERAAAGKEGREKRERERAKEGAETPLLPVHASRPALCLSPFSPPHAPSLPLSSSLSPRPTSSPPATSTSSSSSSRRS